MGCGSSKVVADQVAGEPQATPEASAKSTSGPILRTLTEAFNLAKKASDIKKKPSTDIVPKTKNSSDGVFKKPSKDGVFKKPSKDAKDLVVVVGKKGSKQGGPAAPATPPPKAPPSARASASGKPPAAVVAAAAAAGPKAKGKSAKPLKSAKAQPQPAPPPVVEDDTLATTRYGITLRGLRRLRGKLRAQLGTSMEGMTTAEVNRWVISATSDVKCRLLEKRDLVDGADVAPPMYFISHAWMNRASLLFDYIDSFLADASDMITVWLDILAVNQHSETKAHQHDISAFSDVVKACGAGTIVIMDVANCNPATRGWCIFEWAHTLAAHGPDGLHMQLTPQDRAKVFNTLDVTTAQCQFPRDKDMILKAVAQQHGSPAVFNVKLKLQLLLEPLSYRVDLRRLCDRAATTRWTFGEVTRWLDAGAGAGGRALCVVAGAGEGKSTISAVLVSGALGERITAHHFLKYNDQRRLEPVNIIKSIAFQLALRLPEIQERLLRLDAARVAQLTDVESAFEVLLAGPLRTYAEKAPGKQVVILLDALDEADPLSLQVGNDAGGSGAPTCPIVCGNKALQLISAHLARLPPCVRFIFTTRPDGASGQVLPSLQRTFGGGGGAGGQQDGGLLQLRPQQLRVEPEGEAGGVLVYRAIQAACLAGVGPSSSGASAVREASLEDLYAVYGRVFRAANAAYKGSQGAEVARLMSVLMAAQQPLSHSFLQQLGLGHVISLLPGYPVLFFVDEHHLYTLHKSLGDWLLNTQLSGVYAADLADGHLRIGRRLAESLRSGASPSRYLLKYLVKHLACAARAALLGGGVGNAGGPPTTIAHAPTRRSRVLPPQAVQSVEAMALLDGVLADFGFLQKAMRAGTGSAIVGALGMMPFHSALSYDALRWLRTVLHDLQERPDQVLPLALRATPITSALYSTAAATQPHAWRSRVVMPMVAPYSEWPQLHATLKAHDGAVSCVVFSPDGKQLASGAGDKTLRVFDVATGKLRATLKGHSDMVTSVAWSHDGRQLASGGRDNCGRLWDAATGQCVAVLGGHKGWVAAVAFSPDGRRVATGSHDASVGLWLTASGQEDGRLTIPEAGFGQVTSLAWSPNGRRIAHTYTSVTDSTLRVWDVGTQRLEATLRGQDGDATGVAFSTNSALLAASSGRCVRVYKLDALEAPCVQRLEGHTGKVLAVAFSDMGCQFASAGEDACVRVYDSTTWECTALLDGHSGPVKAIAFSPDGRQLAASSGANDVHVWNVEVRLAEAGQAQAHSGPVLALTWAPEGDIIASASTDATLRVWDSSSGAALATLKGHQGEVTCVAFSQEGKHQLASAGKDRSVRLWEVSRAKCNACMTGHTDRINGLAFSPDGRMLASASDDYTVVLYEVLKGKAVSTLQGHSDKVNCVAYSPDGSVIASGSHDFTVRIWDTKGKCVATLQGHDSWVMSLAFSLDGRYLASGSMYDKAVHVWDTDTWKHVATLPQPAAATSLSWSADGSRLASVCGDAVRLYPAPTWAPLEGEIREHRGDVVVAAFGPDGRLATGGKDGTLRVAWGPGSGVLVSHAQGGGPGAPHKMLKEYGLHGRASIGTMRKDLGSASSTASRRSVAAKVPPAGARRGSLLGKALAAHSQGSVSVAGGMGPPHSMLHSQGSVSSVDSMASSLRGHRRV